MLSLHKYDFLCKGSYDYVRVWLWTYDYDYVPTIMY